MPARCGRAWHGRAGSRVRPLGARIQEAAASIRARLGRDAAADIGLVLGSGLGAMADAAEAAAALAYREIPHFPVPAAEGHRGRLVLGRLEGRRVAVLQGRVHLYEGYTAEQVAFAVRVLRALGAHTLIVTNAAGGLAPDLRAGNLMLIGDHINVTGTNPLVGPNDAGLGPRFPDMSSAYDAGLRAAAMEAARAEQLALREGVYAGVLGPAYETPAEAAMLRRWGADAVGMSTVPEVIAARHAGLRVLGISVITNAVAAEPAAVTHDQVLAVATGAGPRLLRLLCRIVRAL
jgi:purine-nucleoside phosphorylase